ncbi:winged helix-turn-helix transcriptional regulator [Bacillus cereus]|uniref:winged helix-turn-helix transcriptional regulator n=1 Tax=Bacillus cereus TaxID=1396 RepID=UPI0018CD0565|nr:winged helix-turn-helix transcriptional regulator [Bacillus cereus]MBG9613756.1 hypothetical protein [Bacillus cereus]
MDKQWTSYLGWRKEKGYKGLSTEEQYNEYIVETEAPEEGEKLSRKEAKELEEFFEGVTVKENVQTTFEAIKLIAAVGGSITYTDMAKLTGFSLRTVKNHVQELEAKGYLQIKRGEYTNSYYWGKDMRQLDKPKKSIHFVENLEWAGSISDDPREVTIRDGLTETHITTYKIESLLAQTEEYLREADPVGVLRE